MKRIYTLILASCILVSGLTGCVKEEETDISVKLTNHMTETELEKTSIHELTLLDDPDEKEHIVSIELYSIDDMFKKNESMKDQLTAEEYENVKDWLNSEKENDPDALFYGHALIDGCLYNGILPPAGYDGGVIEFEFANSVNGDEPEIEEVKCKNIEEYKSWEKQMALKNGVSEDRVESLCKQIDIVFDAVMNGTYEKLPLDSIDFNDMSIYNDPFVDNRSKWEYNRDEVEKISDSIDEVSIYDEELDTEYLVHVVLPPDYDKENTYPVFFLTDGVWRFGNTPSLREKIESGDADPTILVTLGYDYNNDGSDGDFRFTQLVIEREKLLNFITDNLMPYLGEHYNIDYENSTLYGHSDGGVFSHYAMFKSDLYDNQPFGSYIIGSPAFWGPYDENPEYDFDSEGCKNDYDYWSRNDKLDKKVFLCGGSLEDPDYEDKYDGQPTTLEGLEDLKQRLVNHNADMEYKLYESHHYQYIPDMLIEFLTKEYK